MPAKGPQPRCVCGHSRTKHRRPAHDLDLMTKCRVKGCGCYEFQYSPAKTMLARRKGKKHDKR